MTRVRNGGFVVGRYLRPPAYDADASDAAGTGAAPDDGQAEPTQQPSDGAQGDERGEGQPPADPDPSSCPADQPSAGDDDADGADEDGNESSRIKQLSDEAAKYRNRAKAAEERADQADATIEALRVENAFIRHALPLVDDVTAAWKLSDQSLAKVDDDGNVTGMKKLVQSMIRNYPYLERQPDTAPMPLPGSGGSPANGRRTDSGMASREALAKKYPALRSR